MTPLNESAEWIFVARGRYINCSTCRSHFVGKSTTTSERFSQMTKKQSNTWECPACYHKTQLGDAFIQVFLSPNNAANYAEVGTFIEMPTSSYSNEMPSRFQDSDEIEETSEDDSDDDSDDVYYDASCHLEPDMSADFPNVTAAHREINYLRNKLRAIEGMYPADRTIKRLIAQNRMLKLKLRVHELQIQAVEEQCATNQLNAMKLNEKKMHSSSTRVRFAE